MTALAAYLVDQDLFKSMSAKVQIDEETGLPIIRKKPAQEK